MTLKKLQDMTQEYSFHSSKILTNWAKSRLCTYSNEIKNKILQYVSYSIDDLQGMQADEYPFVLCYLTNSSFTLYSNNLLPFAVQIRSCHTSLLHQQKTASCIKPKPFTCFTQGKGLCIKLAVSLISTYISTGTKNSNVPATYQHQLTAPGVSGMTLTKAHTALFDIHANCHALPIYSIYYSDDRYYYIIIIYIIILLFKVSAVQVELHWQWPRVALHWKL